MVANVTLLPCLEVGRVQGGEYSPPAGVGECSPPAGVGEYSPPAGVGECSPPAGVEWGYV